jgi:tetratricopeptide (TPR) repeat protein
MRMLLSGLAVIPAGEPPRSRSGAAGASVPYCRLMPDVWAPDDLRFALIRAAHLEPPRQVVSDLLAAADQPAARLAGVTAFQARLRAAEVLLEAGQRGEGAMVLREAVREAGPDPDPRTQVDAAAVFAEAGEAAEAEALVMQAFRARPDGYGLLGGLLKVSLGLAALGHFEQALRIADETIARTSRRPGRGGRAALNERISRLAELAREEILVLRRQAQAAGADLTDPRAAREQRDQRLRDVKEGSFSQPPWPAVAGSCLLWWPSAEYSRVIRQVPGLREVLGAPWRAHTARVEQAMAAAAAAVGGATRPSLATAEYEKFAQFLERTGSDPRLAAVMTAFTEHAGPPAPWPPGRHDRCWCGSGKRYHRCCAA